MDTLPTARHTPQNPGNRTDTVYTHWLKSIQDNFIENYQDAPLFTTNQGPALWDAYIDHFPPGKRDYYRCSHCRRFIERYGSLVTINDRGALIPVMWDILRAPSRYRDSVVAMSDILRGNGTWGDYPHVQVTGVFVSSKKEWGTLCTDNWVHYHVLPPSCHVFDGNGGMTANQMSALYRENYQLLQGCLDKYYRKPDYPLIAQEVLLAQKGGSTWAPMEWLHDLTKRMDSVTEYRRDNIVWLAAATAPLSYCHMSTGAVGKYLDNLLLQNSKEEESMAASRLQQTASVSTLRQTALLLNPDPQIIEDIDNILRGARCVPDSYAGGVEGIPIGPQCPVLDMGGNPLLVDGIYYSEQLRTSMKVRSWSFGAGNMLDRYYRVWYTDANLVDSFLVVDATYPKGIYGGAVYQSDLKRVSLLRDPSL